MNPDVQHRLLALNQRFYEQVAPFFDATRQSWTPGLLAIVSYLPSGAKEALTVLDVGCGNGRFARLLAERGIAATYVGVDGNRELLARAQAGAQALCGVTARFFWGDFAQPDWDRMLTPPLFDVTLCTATVQHLPGYDLRLQLVRKLRQHTAQLCVISCWQFLESDRFRSKLIDPASLGLPPEGFEPGDALLPWRQGVEAVRYVHQVDQEELEQLAHDAGFRIRHTYRADGKEGDLNLYAVLEPAAG